MSKLKTADKSANPDSVITTGMRELVDDHLAMGYDLQCLPLDELLEIWTKEFTVIDEEAADRIFDAMSSAIQQRQIPGIDIRHQVAAHLKSALIYGKWLQEDAESRGTLGPSDSEMERAEPAKEKANALEQLVAMEQKWQAAVSQKEWRLVVAVEHSLKEALLEHPSAPPQQRIVAALAIIRAECEAIGGQRSAAELLGRLGQPVSTLVQ